LCARNNIRNITNDADTLRIAETIFRTLIDYARVILVYTVQNNNVQSRELLKEDIEYRKTNEILLEIFGKHGLVFTDFRLPGRKFYSYGFTNGLSLL